MKQEHGSIFLTIRMLAALAMLTTSACVIVGSAGAQTNAAPEFEVASLKVLNGPGVMSLRPLRSGGTIRWDAPLELMLMHAYRLQRWQVLGADRDGTFYSIAAKMDPSATEDDVRLMLRALLSDRLRIVLPQQNLWGDSGSGSRPRL